MLRIEIIVKKTNLYLKWLDRRAIKDTLQYYSQRNPQAKSKYHMPENKLWIKTNELYDSLPGCSLILKKIDDLNFLAKGHFGIFGRDFTADETVGFNHRNWLKG